MNNTTFSFNKKQIVQSVSEPDTRNLWLNSNDNKLYNFCNSGWEPVGGTNIYRIYLIPHPLISGRLALDPKYDKENTLARRAFNEDLRKHTNNIYLITFNTGYDELTGVANCYGNENFLTEIIIGIYQDSKTGGWILSRMIIGIDSEIFRDFKTPNTDVIFRMDKVAIQATSIK
jgi:hypothetical protein